MLDVSHKHNKASAKTEILGLCTRKPKCVKYQTYANGNALKIIPWNIAEVTFNKFISIAFQHIFSAIVIKWMFKFREFHGSTFFFCVSFYKLPEQFLGFMFQFVFIDCFQNCSKLISHCNKKYVLDIRHRKQRKSQHWNNYHRCWKVVVEVFSPNSSLVHHSVPEKVIGRDRMAASSLLFPPISVAFVFFGDWNHI